MSHIVGLMFVPPNMCNCPEECSFTRKNDDPKVPQLSFPSMSTCLRRSFEFFGPFSQWTFGGLCRRLMA